MEKKRDVFIRIMTTVFLASITLFYFIKFANKPFYTNDEVIMRCIANGTYNGTSDGHLVYIMYPLGVIFATLYRIMPSVNWYDGFMLGFHYLSWFLIAYKISTFFKKKEWVMCSQIVTVLGLITLDYRYVIFHQYTDLSAIVAALGVLCLVIFLAYGKKVDCVSSSFFIILSLWIRKESFYIAVPMIVLVYIALGLWKKSRDEVKRTIISASAILSLVAISFCVEILAYASPEWRDYKRYNSARTAMVDYNRFPTYSEAIDILNENDISEEEYGYVASGNYVYADHMTTDIMEKLANRARKICTPTYDTSYFKALLMNIKETVFSLACRPEGAICLACFVAAITYAMLNKKPIECAGLLIAALYKYAFLAYFVFRGRFPERVSHALYMISIMYFLSVLLVNVKYYYSRNGIRKIQSATTVAVVLAFVLFWTVKVLPIRVEISYKDEMEWSPYIEESQKLSYCFEQGKDNVFIVDSTVSNFICDRMFDNGFTKADNVLFLSYWTCGSPLLRDKKKTLGIDSFSKITSKEANIIFIGDIVSDR